MIGRKCSKKLYDDLYEEPDQYMDVPEALKEGFFASLCQNPPKSIVAACRSRTP